MRGRTLQLVVLITATAWAGMQGCKVPRTARTSLATRHFILSPDAQTDPAEPAPGGVIQLATWQEEQEGKRPELSETEPNPRDVQPADPSAQNGNQKAESEPADDGHTNRGTEESPGRPAVEDSVPPPVNTLQLADVLDSVSRAFPPLLAASLEREIALGDLVASCGAFDLQLKGESFNAPLGFYENYRHGVLASQPVWSTGGQVWGGYKLGRGEFQPWFKERQTNEGGELAAGLTLPLLRNRAVDQRRTSVGLADLEVQLADPYVRGQFNQFARDAAVVWWDWVAAGNSFAVQRDLLELAELRADKIEARVREGDLAEIASVDNQRFITTRQTKLVELEQKFRTAAVKLSLYLRDAAGNPVIATEERLPDFPAITAEVESRLDADLNVAMAQRPELLDLDLKRRKLELECRLAGNSALPTVDAVALTSQDVGGAASNPDDKGDLEFEAGVIAEVPLQRRAARGKVAALQGKLSQLDFRRQFLCDRIAAELRAALVALENLARQIGLAERNLELAEEALRIGRASFDEGNIDLIVLNIYEQSVADARLTLVLARHDWFAAFADYKFALGQTGIDE